MKDGKFAFTSGQGGSIKVWNLEDKSTHIGEIPTENNGISKIRYKDGSLYVGFRLISSVDENGPGYIAQFNDTLGFLEKHYYRGKQNYKKVELPNFDFEKDGSIAAGTYWGQEVRNAYALGSKEQFIGPIVGAQVLDVSIIDSIMVLGTNKGILRFVKNGNKYVRLESNSELDKVQINAVDFDKVSQRIIGAGDNGKVYVWDLVSNSIKILQDHHDKISDVVFSPDGSYFVSGSWDNRAIVWKNDDDLHSITPLHQIKVHNSDIEDVDISSDNIIATSSSDNTVQLHQISPRDFRLRRLPSLINHDYSIRAVTFGPTSNILFTGDKKGVIKKWDRRNFLDF